MEQEALRLKLKQKLPIQQWTEEMAGDPRLVNELIDIVDHDSGTLKFSCSKILRQVSESNPELIYSHFDALAQWLLADNSFVKWDGILILANLTAVDQMKRFESVFDAYFNLLHDVKMVTAANVVRGAAVIIHNRPELEDRITRRLLQIPQITYYYKGKPSIECSRVLFGHLIDAFQNYYDVSAHKSAIREFVIAQLTCERASTRKKAAEFIKRHP